MKLLLLLFDGMGFFLGVGGVVGLLRRGGGGGGYSI